MALGPPSLGPPSSSSASTPMTPSGANRAMHRVWTGHREVASINHRYQRGRSSVAYTMIGGVTSIPWCMAPLWHLYDCVARTATIPAGTCASPPSLRNPVRSADYQV